MMQIIDQRRGIGPNTRMMIPFAMRPAAFAALMALAGCQGTGEFPSLNSVDADGATTYKDNCMSCHGASGRGDGVMAASLPVAPADLSQLAAANGGKFPRDRVIEIVHGYPGQSHARVMPDFGSRLGGRTVIHVTEDGARLPTPEGLLALVDYIESLQVQ